MDPLSGISELRTLLCGKCNHEFVTVCIPGIPLETLRSSSIPSQSERLAQLEILDLESRTLREYDEHIEAITETLQKLRHERSSLQRRIEARKQLMSSRIKLPVEIWRCIFLEACYPLEQENHPQYLVAKIPFLPIHLDHDKRKARALPLLLSRICFEWRRIISDFPTIWSSIGIGPRWLSASTLPTLESLIVKTRGQPLRLRLEGSFRDGRHVRNGGMPGKICQVFVDAFLQTRELEISAKFLNAFLHGHSLSFPLLQSLTFINYTETCFFKEQVQALLSAPLLTKLVLSDMDSIPGLDSFPSTITSFECWRVVDIGDFDRIVNSFPRLKTMKLTLSGLEEYAGDWVVALPWLEDLEICSYMRNPGSFLDHLSLPSLTSLSFSFSESMANRWNNGADLLSRFTSSLAECVQRSGCNLCSLSLASPYDDLSHRTDWISRLLRLSPGLTSITFTTPMPRDGIDVLDSTFYRVCSLLTLPQPSNDGVVPDGSTKHRATNEQDSYVFLPNLYYLKIEISGYHHVVENAAISTNVVHLFLQVAESRTKRAASQQVAALRHAELVLTHIASDGSALDVPKGDIFKDELRLRRGGLVEGGMECRIEGY